MNLTLNRSLDKRKSDSVCLKFVHAGPPGSPGASEGGLVDGAFSFIQKICLRSYFPIFKNESEVKQILSKLSVYD